MSSFAFVYLASQSPRRAQLLAQLGVAYRLLRLGPAHEAEALEAVHGKEAPARYVQRVTRLKLHAAQEQLARQRRAPAPILCADTTVALGSEILGKPCDARQAAHMLQRLSGKTHRVCTAVGLSYRNEQHFALCVSSVRFAPLEPQQIDSYVASGEPFGKAGAYAVQGRAAAFIERIRGSYSGVMGLPLFETAQLLRVCGWAP